MTRYGFRYKSKPQRRKMFLNWAISCRASMSCRQSSPTLKMADSQTSTEVTRGSLLPSMLFCSFFSLRTLNFAMKGALVLSAPIRASTRLDGYLLWRGFAAVSQPSDQYPPQRRLDCWANIHRRQVLSFPSLHQSWPEKMSVSAHF